MSSSYQLNSPPLRFVRATFKVSLSILVQYSSAKRWYYTFIIRLIRLHSIPSQHLLPTPPLNLLHLYYHFLPTTSQTPLNPLTHSLSLALPLFLKVNGSNESRPKILVGDRVRLRPDDFLTNPVANFELQGRCRIYLLQTSLIPLHLLLQYLLQQY